MKSWQLGPFTRAAGAVLTELPHLDWASKDLFNPGGVMRDGKLHLLVRGEDSVGQHAGVSRIGLAVNTDGFTFEVEPEPVIAPGDDEWQTWEAAGGCEDPRVVEAADGGYVCTYTGFDGNRPTLMVATRTTFARGASMALPSWTALTPDGRSSKSGAIVTEARDGRLVAVTIDGRFGCTGGRAPARRDIGRPRALEPVEFDATGDRSLAFDPETRSWNVHRMPGEKVLRPVSFRAVTASIPGSSSPGLLQCGRTTASS